MQRRGGSGQPVKGRRRLGRKARKGPIPATSPEQFEHESREREDVLEELAATSEVLKVISHSTFDLQAVLDALIATATRLCGADMGILRRRVGNVFELAATCGVKAKWRKAIADHPNVPGRHSIIGRAAASGQTVQVADVLEDPEYVNTATQQLIGFRAILVTPMIRDGSLIGTLGFFKLKPSLFTRKQVELIENFAAQAVVAIENTRLLSELRQRTDDLSESLEQQTATSEVLKVISSSPSDLQPVFQSMLENSVRICEAKFGQMFLCEGDKVRAVAQLDVPAALVQEDEQRGAFRPSPEGGLMRAIRTKKVIHIDDLMSEQPSLPVVKLGGARSYIAVPMLKESELVGGS